jgi:hypothetical protein
MAQPSSSDNWGPVADAAAIEAVKDELATKFKGWSFVARMLEREVAVMIRVSQCVVFPGRGCCWCLVNLSVFCSPPAQPTH